MAGRSLNKVMLIGNLGADPETRFTSSGAQVTTFSVATNETYKDQSGNLQERVQWHNIITWNKLAEICSQYLKKGSKVYLEGRIQYRTYDDKNGIKRYVTEIIGEQLIMLDSKGSPSSQDIPQSIDSASLPPEPESTDSDLPF